MILLTRKISQSLQKIERSFQTLNMPWNYREDAYNLKKWEDERMKQLDIRTDKYTT